jgi:hypothetical protein
MSIDETSESHDDLSNELPETSNESTNSDAPNRTLNRRRFLTAAALGTAAAALLNKGNGGYLSFGPALALANDLSGNPCTAQDVTVAPQAFVVNEPCTCTGTTFTASVSFVVSNHTGTSRYCVTLHIPAGFGVPAQDVVLTGPTGNEIQAGQTITMTGQVTGFPCNVGEVCIGSPGSDGRRKCEPNTCLTVAWNTSPNAACPDTSPPGGQCRHQRICILGFGATLACTAGCTPSCGGTATLRACVTAPATRGPFTFTLVGSDGSTQTQSGVAGDASGTTCVNFTVTVSQSTTYTLTVTDKDGCTRTATTTLTTQTLTKPTVSAGTPSCTGQVTLTASPCTAGITYTFKDGGTVLGTGDANCQLTTTLSPGDHSITVTASNGTTACDVTSNALTVHINEAVTATLGAPQSGCSGVVTLLATAGGGSDSYTFTFNGASGGTVTGNGSTRTITFQPQLDGVCRKVSVTVTDTAGCSATSGEQSFSQCVTTTTGC